MYFFFNHLKFKNKCSDHINEIPNESNLIPGTLNTNQQSNNNQEIQGQIINKEQLEKIKNNTEINYEQLEKQIDIAWLSISQSPDFLQNITISPNETLDMFCSTNISIANMGIQHKTELQKIIHHINSLKQFELCVSQNITKHKDIYYTLRQFQTNSIFLNSCKQCTNPQLLQNFMINILKENNKELLLYYNDLENKQEFVDISKKIKEKNLSLKEFFEQLYKNKKSKIMNKIDNALLDYKNYQIKYQLRLSELIASLSCFKPSVCSMSFNLDNLIENLNTPDLTNKNPNEKQAIFYEILNQNIEKINQQELINMINQQKKNLFDSCSNHNDITHLEFLLQNVYILDYKKENHQNKDEKTINTKKKIKEIVKKLSKQPNILNNLKNTIDQKIHTEEFKNKILKLLFFLNLEDATLAGINDEEKSINVFFFNKLSQIAGINNYDQSTQIILRESETKLILFSFLQYVANDDTIKKIIEEIEKNPTALNEYKKTYENSDNNDQKNKIIKNMINEIEKNQTILNVYKTINNNNYIKNIIKLMIDKIEKNPIILSLYDDNNEIQNLFKENNLQYNDYIKQYNEKIDEYKSKINKCIAETNTLINQDITNTPQIDVEKIKKLVQLSETISVLCKNEKITIESIKNSHIEMEKNMIDNKLNIQDFIKQVDNKLQSLPEYDPFIVKSILQKKIEIYTHILDIYGYTEQESIESVNEEQITKELEQITQTGTNGEQTQINAENIKKTKKKNKRIRKKIKTNTGNTNNTQQTNNSTQITKETKSEKKLWMVKNKKKSILISFGVCGTIYVTFKLAKSN